jgi:hypothetical protein
MSILVATVEIELYPEQPLYGDDPAKVLQKLDDMGFCVSEADLHYAGESGEDIVELVGIEFPPQTRPRMMFTNLEEQLRIKGAAR